MGRGVFFCDVLAGLGLCVYKGWVWGLLGLEGSVVRTVLPFLSLEFLMFELCVFYGLIINFDQFAFLLERKLYAGSWLNGSCR